MLDEYIPIAILFLASTALAFVAILLGVIFGPRRQNPRKSMPYESGQVPFGQAQRRFPIQFYLVAVLFILFDVEIIFFYPWAVMFRALGLFGFIEMLIFIAILLVGYVYVWKKGALEWE
ncbi:MAG TPA: NADH-quinone oxidoreductase subunit A [Anaerolineae bacterium]|nr:NADH-quinone oxidoreductase subunit A [Anaerolineae bacterium]